MCERILREVRRVAQLSGNYAAEKREPGLKSLVTISLILIDNPALLHVYPLGLG